MQPRLKTFAASLALSLAALATGADAAVLAGAGPYTAALNGAQSDQGVLVLPSLTFTTPANATLQEIVWWGYRLNLDPLAGPPYDYDFTITLGSTTYASVSDGVVEATLGNVDLIRYTLDVPDVALSASTISIVSNALSFEWYWQGINAAPDGDPDFSPAVNLIGTVNTIDIPEPGSLALVALAGMALLATRRAR